MSLETPTAQSSGPITCPVTELVVDVQTWPDLSVLLQSLPLPPTFFFCLRIFLNLFEPN